LRTLDGQLLGDIDVLAAAVVSLARVPFSIFVRQNGALRFQHARARVVLRRNQFDVVFLTATLRLDSGLQLGIEIGNGQFGWKHGHSGKGNAYSTGMRVNGGWRTGDSEEFEPNRLLRFAVRCPRVTCQEALNDPRPSAREIAAVVTAAAHRENAAVPEFVGERTQTCRGVRVRFLREPKMRDRIACQAVGAALEQDELGAPFAQQRFGALPEREERRVVSTGR